MLRSNKFRRSWWFGILCLAALGAQTTRADLVEITVATDKAIYQLDEDVLVSVTAFNPTSEPVTLGFGSALEANYLMDGQFNWYQYKIFALSATHLHIAGGDSHTWHLCHGPMERGLYPLELGPHTLVGQVRATQLLGDWNSPSCTFTVVPEPAGALLGAWGILVGLSRLRRRAS